MKLNPAVLRTRSAARLADTDLCKQAMSSEHVQRLLTGALYLVTKEATRQNERSQRRRAIICNPRTKIAMDRLDLSRNPGFDKQAEGELKSLLENLKALAGNAMESAGQAGESLKDFGTQAANTAQDLARKAQGYDYAAKYKELMADPVIRSAVMGGMIGAPVMGGLSALSGDTLGGNVKNTLAGLLVGGLLGGAGQKGVDYLRAQQGAAGGEGSEEVRTDGPFMRPTNRSAGSVMLRPGVAGDTERGDLELDGQELSEFLKAIDYDSPIDYRMAERLGFDSRPLGESHSPSDPSYSPSLTSLHRPRTSDDPLTQINPLSADSAWWQPHNQLYGGNVAATAAGSIGSLAAPTLMAEAARSDAPEFLLQKLRGRNYRYDPDRISASAKTMFGTTPDVPNNLPTSGTSHLRETAKVLQELSPADMQRLTRSGFDPRMVQDIINRYADNTTLDQHLKDVGLDPNLKNVGLDPAQPPHDLDQVKPPGKNPTAAEQAAAKSERFGKETQNRHWHDKKLRERLNLGFQDEDIRSLHNATPSRTSAVGVDSVLRQMGGTGDNAAGWLRKQLPTAGPRHWKGRGLAGLASYGAANYGLPKLLGLGPTSDDEVQARVQHLLQSPEGKNKYDAALKTIFDSRAKRKAQP